MSFPSRFCSSKGERILKRRSFRTVRVVIVRLRSVQWLVSILSCRRLGMDTVTRDVRVLREFTGFFYREYCKTKKQKSSRSYEYTCTQTQNSHFARA